MKKTFYTLLLILSASILHAQNTLLFDITTDNYASETSWEITDESLTNVLYSSPIYTTNANQYETVEMDLPNGNYVFTIHDSAGDGICCGYGEGNYSLVDVTTGATIASGGEFDASESTSFVLPYIPPAAGCTDPTAYNYSSEAEVDDGSCLYLESPLTIDLETVATGLSSIVDISNAGDERLFLVSQSGQIKILHPETGLLEATDFIDISSSITSGGEQGLLGLVFHPDYATNGYFYVNYTKPNGDSRIARYSVSDDPNIADPNSEVIILEQDQPYGNHNAGDLNFGPDGYLYIPFGDGGSGGDPNNNAQNGLTWLGKMLRINVDETSEFANYSIPSDNPFVGNTDYLDEIWSFGLRNTWRFSFDALTGEMWMGDVGQNAIEEIDVEPAGQGGANYGWRCYEGTQEYDTSLCGDVGENDVVMPIFEYDHSSGACAVTGGYVYRGTEFPAMVGKYFFVDYCNGVFRSLELAGDNYIERIYSGDFGNYFPTFGEGVDGSIYVSGAFGGTVFKLVDPCNDFQPTITITDNGDLEATEGTDYLWIINGEVTSFTDQVLTDIDLANNTYQVTVTNESGCSKLSEILNVVTLDEITSENRIQIFPNPAQNLIHIEQPYFSGEYSISIVDARGTLVINETTKNTIDISELSAGKYILVLSNKKQSYRKKFIKK